MSLDDRRDELFPMVEKWTPSHTRREMHKSHANFLRREGWDACHEHGVKPLIEALKSISTFNGRLSPHMPIARKALEKYNNE